MLSKDLINDHLTLIKEKGRMIDYYLLQHLFEFQSEHIIHELKQYQNSDGGFGHGLEPDVWLPESNIVSTDEAVMILDEIEPFSLKKTLIQTIIAYYETTYIEKKKGWELVPPEVDDFPHAIWWNYSRVDEFTYGNPNPQIIGFLYRYKQYVKQLNVKELVDGMVDYIKHTFPSESSKHNILSCLLFYKEMPQQIKTELQPILQQAIDTEFAKPNWQEYGLQPYEVLLIDKSFLKPHQDLLKDNLEYLTNLLETGLIMPNWQWYQYEKEFEQAKWLWAGYLTFRVIKALLQ